MAKILIIDDEAPVRELLKKMVQRLGHEAMTASSASEALALIQAFCPDMAFVDLVMPETGGLTLIMERLRAVPGLKIIVMSGRIPLDGDSVNDLALRFGVACTMKKPFTVEQVAVIIEDSLKGRC